MKNLFFAVKGYFLALFSAIFTTDKPAKDEFSFEAFKAGLAKLASAGLHPIAGGANAYSAIIPTIMTEALEVLRESCATLSAVNKGYSSNAKEVGDTITIPVPVAQTTTAVVPATTPPANTDQTPATVTIALNHWEKTDFHMSDKDANEIEKGRFKNTQSAESIRAIANKIDTDTFAAAYDGVDNTNGVAQHVGTAGTTPFATEALLATVWQKGARKLLNTALASKADRFVVLDEDAEGNATSLDLFVKANERGDKEGITEGEIGRKLGATWLMNQNVPTFTGGTLSNGSGKLADVDGVVAADATTMAIDESTLTGTLLTGDVFTVASVTGYFMVTNGTLTAAANAIAAVNFYPAAPVGGFADDAVITFAADHVLNMAFHRNAFALAFAPAKPDDDGGNTIVALTDPQTGVTLQLEISREYFQTTWRFSVLYGVACPRPELACRIMG